MDEAGKWFLSVGLIALGAFLIILSLVLGILDLLTVLIFGVALCGFGSFLYYLRHVSITSQARVKKATITTRVVREVPKPKPKPVETVSVEPTPQRPEILCDTCQFYTEHAQKQKCRFLSDKERLAMINSGIQCVEYKIRLTMLDED